MLGIATLKVLLGCSQKSAKSALLLVSRVQENSFFTLFCARFLRWPRIRPFRHDRRSFFFVSFGALEKDLTRINFLPFKCLSVVGQWGRREREKSLSLAVCLVRDKEEKNVYPKQFFFASTRLKSNRSQKRSSTSFNEDILQCAQQFYHTAKKNRSIKKIRNSRCPGRSSSDDRRQFMSAFRCSPMPNPRQTFITSQSRWARTMLSNDNLYSLRPCWAHQKSEVKQMTDKLTENTTHRQVFFTLLLNIVTVIPRRFCCEHMRKTTNLTHFIVMLLE